MDTLLFSIEPISIQEVKTYLETCQIPKTLNLAQKQKLAIKAKAFILKEGIMYRVGQDNKMHRCLTSSKAHIVLKELHEGVARGHFVADIIAKKILNARY
jgi:hypothetical protein